MAQRHDVGCLCKPRLLLPVLSPHDRQSRLDHVSRMLLLTGMCCSTCSACNLTPTTTSASRATPSAAMVSAHHGCCAWAASRGGSTAWSGVRGGGLGVLDIPHSREIQDRAHTGYRLPPLLALVCAAGVAWTFSNVEPFNGTVVFVDGSVSTVALLSLCCFCYTAGWGRGMGCMGWRRLLLLLLPFGCHYCCCRRHRSLACPMCDCLGRSWSTTF
jgi:hypothetical protein